MCRDKQGEGSIRPSNTKLTKEGMIVSYMILSGCVAAFMVVDAVWLATYWDGVLVRQASPLLSQSVQAQHRLSAVVQRFRWNPGRISETLRTPGQHSTSLADGGGGVLWYLQKRIETLASSLLG